MQENENSTIKELKNYLQANLSEKRYTHVLGVADTTEQVLKHYNCTNYISSWNGTSAGYFCGLAHDISRELSVEKWFAVCKENNYEIPEDANVFPIILHGPVSAFMIKQMFPGVPASWLRAIEIHTMGNKDMDDLALALYIADYIEPNRTYLNDEQRKKYLSCPSIQLCAYSILCDTIKYLQSKGTPFSRDSLLMKEFLEQK